MYTQQTTMSEQHAQTSRQDGGATQQQCKTRSRGRRAPLRASGTMLRNTVRDATSEQDACCSSHAEGTRKDTWQPASKTMQGRRADKMVREDSRSRWGGDPRTRKRNEVARKGAGEATNRTETAAQAKRATRRLLRDANTCATPHSGRPGAKLLRIEHSLGDVRVAISDVFEHPTLSVRVIPQGEPVCLPDRFIRREQLIE